MRIYWNDAPSDATHLDTVADLWCKEGNFWHGGGWIRTDNLEDLGNSRYTPRPVNANPMDDNCPAARIGELGNQVHNLGCDYQNDEDLSDELGQVAVTLWDIAKKAAIRPVEAWQPEVGEVCECDWAGTGCFSAAIVKYAGSSIIIVTCDDSELIVFVEDAAEQLRPVRTQAQRDREEAISTAHALLIDTDTDRTVDGTLAALYDAGMLRRAKD